MENLSVWQLSPRACYIEWPYSGKRTAGLKEAVSLFTSSVFFSFFFFTPSLASSLFLSLSEELRELFFLTHKTCLSFLCFLFLTSVYVSVHADTWGERLCPPGHRDILIPGDQTTKRGCGWKATLEFTSPRLTTVRWLRSHTERHSTALPYRPRDIVYHKKLSQAFYEFFKPPSHICWQRAPAHLLRHSLPLLTISFSFSLLKISCLLVFPGSMGW